MHGGDCQAMWLYYRFTLSFRDVEELLAARGVDVSYETVWCWAEKFGLAIAANIRQSRPRPGSVWHLNEMVVRINGKRMFLWRAVDDEGEVLDALVQKRRNARAAKRLLPTTRAEDAALQISGPGPALCFHSRSHLQSLRRSTSPDFTIHSPHLPGYRHGGMECRVCCSGVSFQLRNLVRPTELT
jgi:hypothetical protein